MKEYVFLFTGGLDFATASMEEIQQAMMKWKNWIEQLTKEGRYNGGSRLEPNGRAVIKGSRKQVFDGPHTESKEVVGGFISINANNKEEAIEIAKGCPIFTYDGNVEIGEVAKM